jgi:type I restriction enzyme S subunit
MKHWPTKSLGEVCAINPKLAASDVPAVDSEVTFVPMAAVDERSGSIIRPEVRQYHQVAKGYTSFRENDVLFAKITPCMENGKAAIARGLVNHIGFGSTEFHVLRPSSKLLPEWLFAFIRQPSFRSEAEANFTGTAGQRRVPSEFMKRTAISVPPLAEQRRMTKLLDDADELRRLRVKAGDRTAVLIPALFDEMFGDPGANPQGLPIIRLGELCRVLPNYGTMIPASATKGEWLTIRVANIQAGLLNLADQKFVDIPDDMLDRHTVRDGDLLLARAIGSKEHLGKCIVVYPRSRKWAFDSHLMRIRLRRERCEPVWLKTLLDSPGGRALFLANTRQSAVQFNINSKEFANIAVPLPPMSVQKEFAGRVKEIRELEAKQVASRDRLDDLFQSMLRRAFSGEL